MSSNQRPASGLPDLAPPSDRLLHEIFSGGGETGALMRSIDWARTSLGPVENWPQSLRTAVSILLESRFPMYLAWGPEYVQLYNDGYRPILGSTKHPAAMGRPARPTFSESWHIIGPMFDGVRQGQAVGSQNWMLPLDRHGYLEECYFTYSYSPIRDESRGVGGVLVTVTETTAQVLGERRLRTLRDLADPAQAVRREDEVWREAARTLENNPFDVPFALLYRSDDAESRHPLMASVGWGPDGDERAHRLGTETFERAVAEAASTRKAVLVSELHTLPGGLPGGRWPEAPRCALALPIARPGADRPYGVLVTGVSARRALDDDYRGFLGLIADQISTAVSNARALADEKRRAEALAELDRTKTAFFSNVSHEFRTPLTLMLGPAEDSLADEAEPLSPAQRERLDLIRRNGLRLQKLVNSLLDFARLEAGRAQASFVPTDLAALTRDLASGFESAMASAGLSLELDCPPLGAPVYVDPAMWEKIVLNLLSNALKFTFEGGVRVSLRQRGDLVALTVDDSGTGIPEHELPRVFERFHRVEGARGRSHEGSGIGLALVRELVRLHGGTVAAQSTLGKGSTFTVSLPTGAAHLPRERIGDRDAPAPPGIGLDALLAEVTQWNGAQAAAPRAGSSGAPEPTASAAPAGARILVVDDNADMRGYLSRLLSPQWTVEAVEDGGRALAAAVAHPPDLVLTDVMMPGLGGLELVRALRASEATRTVPVVLLSARAGEEATLEGLASGADDYLIKPFSSNELLARVRAQLTISRLQEETVRVARSHAETSSRHAAEAERATRSREETLGIVSHDLRSPLAAILSSTGLIARSAGGADADPALKRHAETIRRSAQRMKRLVEDLLDLASIDGGNLSLAPSPRTAEGLVEEARESFAAQALEQGVTLVTDVPAGLPAVCCDRERILQVFSNLLSNALRYTPRGGTITLRARTAPGADAIRFEVADTGPGIPEEMRAHLFDRQWHTRRRNREGHGLGLSISKGIVESHGGRLQAESSPGAGSTFSFSIPLEPVATGVAPALPPASPGPYATPPGPADSFIQGGGEMGALIRALDWSRNSLGPIEGWPQSLRTSVSTMLRSPYPIILFWGPQLRMLYNDPFRPILGAKHPATVGARGYEALVEEWTQLGPLMKRVLDTGEPVFIENGNVNFERRPGGLREEAYFTWSYNPTIGEKGEIAGLFAIASETTRQVVGERRLKVLRELSIRTAGARTVDEVFGSFEAVLAQAGHDLPFALLYVVTGEQARLVGCTGVERGSPAAPVSPKLDDPASWPLSGAARSQQESLVEDLGTKFGPLPGGPWPEPSTRALVLPVPIGADAESSGVLVAGLSPLRALDPDYRSFLQLLARQLAASISSARAYEEEKQRAEKLAQLDQAKTAFFGNVSHEFRTPLTLILGPLEDALSKQTKALEGESLELVRRNALRLYKLVNTLLDFSRIEAGRAQATYVAVDLATFTTHLASAFRSAVEAAGLRFEVDCPPLPEAVYVDLEMWEKIVLNLLSNAVKYTHRGEIQVRLRWEDAHAVLTVRDTGTGIPEEELPRIFERFYRVRSTEARSHEGTGIGLSLAQELVMLHGGRLEVSSKLGEGSTFAVKLPRGSAHLPPERIERAPHPRTSPADAAPFVDEALRWFSDPSAEAGASASADEPLVDVPPGLSSARILLVDDNADLRAYVARLLRQTFPNVETATNGTEALERARAHPPDLVLSDVMMPGLDGFGLVGALRADARTRGTPIILLSARAGADSTVEGLRSGADDYLVKPFSARELLARVRTQLELRQVRREVAAREAAAQQLLETVRARDEWLTVVSHELRTPLSALTLSVEAILRGAASADSRARAIEKPLQRMTRLVEQLVDVAELATGQLELAREEVDLSALARSAVLDLGEKAARMGCAISVDASAPVLGFHDPLRLRQLLHHLLDNAIRFGAGKPIALAVSGGREGASIRVVDHGTGIAEKERERVFGRFERAASARNYGGFGLGLWLSRRIAEEHSGSIRLSETEGGGTTVEVLFPAAGTKPDPAAG